MVSIGEEIQQKKFANEYNKLVINVLFTGSWLNGLHNTLFKEYKLTQQQYNTLRILRGQHPKAASVNLIKDRMIDKMSNVSRIIDKLKAKSLVTRKPCKDDRRQVDIKITDAGLELLEEIDKRIKPFEEGLHNISEAEAATINKLLDKWRG